MLIEGLASWNEDRKSETYYRKGQAFVGIIGGVTGVVGALKALKTGIDVVKKVKAGKFTLKGASYSQISEHIDDAFEKGELTPDNFEEYLSNLSNGKITVEAGKNKPSENETFKTQDLEEFKIALKQVADNDNQRVSILAEGKSKRADLGLLDENGKIVKLIEVKKAETLKISDAVKSNVFENGFDKRKGMNELEKEIPIDISLNINSVSDLNNGIENIKKYLNDNWSKAKINEMSKSNPNVGIDRIVNSIKVGDSVTISKDGFLKTFYFDANGDWN